MKREEKWRPPLSKRYSSLLHHRLTTQQQSHLSIEVQPWNMPDVPLPQRLQGTWRLDSYITHPTAESSIQRPLYPMGKNVTGLLMYTSDGYMSAQMLMPGQHSFDGATDSQWAEAGKRSFTYAGPYFVSMDGQDGKEALRHSFEVCILPNRIGEIEFRSHRFEEDGQVLVLGGEETTIIKGETRIPVLRWRRAKDNAEATAPAALPEIRLG